ncbi:MAG: hypothetical protein NVSMB21_06040 [Vulcanimicrobiaceae bacterium]
MRLRCIALLGFVTVTGCSITADAIPDAKGHTKGFVLHVDRSTRGRDVVAQRLGMAPIVDPARATTTTKTATDAAAQPNATPEAATTIDIAAVASVANAANAALALPSQLERLRRDLTLAVIVLATLAAAGVIAGATFVRARRTRRPGIGLPAPPSSEVRDARARSSVAAAPLGTLEPALAEDDAAERPTRVVLTESRFGERRAYYTLESPS